MARDVYVDHFYLLDIPIVDAGLAATVNATDVVSSSLINFHFFSQSPL